MIRRTGVLCLVLVAGLVVGCAESTDDSEPAGGGGQDAVADDRAAERAEAAEAAEPAPPPDPEPASDCDPNYSGCVPIASDVDCEGGGDGPEYTGYVTVIGTDIYGLDRDGDGTACE